MQIFIKTEGYELWNIVTKGPCIPTIAIDKKVVEKFNDQDTQEDFVELSKNNRAMDLLYCDLNANQCNYICACGRAKEIWKVGSNI